MYKVKEPGPVLLAFSPAPDNKICSWYLLNTKLPHYRNYLATMIGLVIKQV
jgi:hypothetical protein